MFCVSAMLPNIFQTLIYVLTVAVTVDAKFSPSGPNLQLKRRGRRRFHVSKRERESERERERESEKNRQRERDRDREREKTDCNYRVKL